MYLISFGVHAQQSASPQVLYSTLVYSARHHNSTNLLVPKLDSSVANRPQNCNQRGLIHPKIHFLKLSHNFGPEILHDEYHFGGLICDNCLNKHHSPTCQ